MNVLRMDRVKKPAADNLYTRRKRSIFTQWQLYVMLLPMIAYLLIFAYKPMYGIIIAFKDFRFRKGILGSEWIGFENFTRFFDSHWFPIVLKNTLLISGLSLLVGFPVPIIIALMVNEIDSKRVKKAYQMLSYAPHFISTVVVCGMITVFLSDSGIINNLLQAIGLPKQTWLQDENTFPWVYVLSGIWQEAGWGAIIYFAALASVDKELLEAAKIDGASRLQRIRYVNLPAIMPTIVIMLILRCGSLMSLGYEKVFLLQSPVNLMASEVISTYVYKTGIQGADFSFSTAVGLMNSVVNVILLLTVNKISKRVTDSGLW